MSDLKGKNKVNDIGQAKHPVTRQKSLDFVRLSSKSTPENPRMLGGTKEEALNYLNKEISDADKRAFYKYRDYYDSLLDAKDPDATKKAEEKYPDGHEIYKKYNRLYVKQAGESSTWSLEPGPLEHSLLKRLYLYP